MIDPPRAQELYDVAVIGGGAVGLSSAIALSQAGARVALVAKRSAYPDNRTTALLGASVDFLENIDVWRRCSSTSSPLKMMRLVDDTGRLLRAPEVTFRCEDIGREEFGFNIENRLLVDALQQRAVELETLTPFDDDADDIALEQNFATTTTKGGQRVSSRLVVGADGRQSRARDAAGIGVDRRELGQSALTFNVTHSRPHHNISTEFHTPHGPCVFVPLPGDRSSVVWVMKPEDAARLRQLDSAELAFAAERQSHSILGKMKVEEGRFVFPLAVERPHRLAASRIMLAGEAAHVIPPIGAQGLNLGLRDAAAIANLVDEARMLGDDPGADDSLARYERSRKTDIASRTLAIDLANRSLLSELIPLQPVRAAGLHLLNAIGPLRRLAMRQGISQSGVRTS